AALLEDVPALDADGNTSEREASDGPAAAVDERAAPDLRVAQHDIPVIEGLCLTDECDQVQRAGAPGRSRCRECQSEKCDQDEGLCKCHEVSFRPHRS